MFERTLASSWDERSRRSLTTLTSLGVQALVVAVLLIAPATQADRIPTASPAHDADQLGPARTGASSSQAALGV